MIESVKATHPNTPLTLYANGSGGLLERLGATGADVVGLDWTVDMADARQRLGSKSVQVRHVSRGTRQGVRGLGEGRIQSSIAVDMAGDGSSWAASLCS